MTDRDVSQEIQNNYAELIKKRDHAMTDTNCHICGKEFWKDGVVALPQDSRYCVDCVCMAAEMIETMVHHSDKLKQAMTAKNP